MKKTVLVFLLWLGAVALLLVVGALLTSCKSPYSVCNASGAYRCHDTVVELCDGENWQPREDCRNMKLECMVYGATGEAGCEEGE
jgi:hypothetical protein